MYIIRFTTCGRPQGGDRVCLMWTHVDRGRWGSKIGLSYVIIIDDRLLNDAGYWFNEWRLELWLH